jgi:cytidine deaminase
MQVNRYLEMAKGVALTSKCRYKHGAIVVKHGHVLGSGVNVTKNSPRYVDWRYSSVHAEIAAMKKAGWPKRATIYVARVNNHGEARMSKPCPNCQEVLDEFRCKVEWTE